MDEFAPPLPSIRCFTQPCPQYGGLIQQVPPGLRRSTWSPMGMSNPRIPHISPQTLTPIDLAWIGWVGVGSGRRRKPTLAENRPSWKIPRPVQMFSSGLRK
eukprot:1770440-Pyramimonas_sp.AAC.1